MMNVWACGRVLDCRRKKCQIWTKLNILHRDKGFSTKFKVKSSRLKAQKRSSPIFCWTIGFSLKTKDFNMQETGNQFTRFLLVFVTPNLKEYESIEVLNTFTVNRGHMLN